MIGVVRHFKVNFKTKQYWMTADQFNQWVEQYDQAAIEPAHPFHSTIMWDVCWSSDLLRATNTAELIYNGVAEPTELLREIGVKAVLLIKLKLPIHIWMMLGRIAWFCSHSSQSETKQQTIQRANQIIDMVEQNYAGANVLLVSHGAFMKVLFKELKRRGYKGKIVMTPKNGELYLFKEGHRKEK